MIESSNFYDLQQIKDALSGRIDEFVLTLFPAAKREASCYKIGGITGEKGGSMIISTRANNPGFYLDFADPEVKGPPWRLVSLVKGCSIREGIAWLASFLNVPPIQSFGAISRAKEPEKLATEMVELSKDSIAYAESRGITEETLRKYGVCSDSRGGLMFPYYDTFGKLGMVKHWGHKLKADGKKDTWIMPSLDAVQSLFGKDVCDPETGLQKLTICEGEFDAMACWQLGIPAVSIPMGASNTKWITEDYQYLSHFDEIVLLFDNDDAGKKGAKEAAARLGSERCLIVTLPLKDANDMLRAGRGWEIKQIIETTTREPIAEIVEPTSMMEGTRSYMKGDHLTEGDPFFIPDYALTFRKHETTLWFGFTGHGKALALDTVIPTPNGMMLMKDVQTGDWVYDENGEPVEVINQSPVFLNHDCYEIEFDNGQKIIADAGHRWTVDTFSSRSSKERAKKKKRNKPGYDQRHKMSRALTLTTEEIAATFKQNSGRLEYSIPVCGSTSGGVVKADLPIPPYTLGAWLGDGHSGRPSMTCHPDDVQIIREMEKDGYDWKKLKTPFAWSSPNGLKKALRENLLIKNKHIPEIYLRADRESRIELLQGLMDTDGSCSNNQCEFCTIIPSLAIAVLELVSSLGIKARIIEGNATIDGRFISRKYRVMFTTDITVFKLERKKQRQTNTSRSVTRNHYIKSVRKVSSVPVKCITVDSPTHLFLCSESHIPTHNSVCVANQIASLAARGKLICVASFEQPPEMTFAQILTQFTAYPNLPYTEEFVPAFNHLAKHVFMYKSMERVDPKHLVNTFVHAHKRYGVDTFVIDNVMTMQIDRGDNTAQAEAADLLRVFVSKYPVHLHIVAHPRKPPENTNKPPAISEIRGASEWADMVFNVVTVWRDTAKAERLAEMDSSDFTEEDQKTFFNSTPCGKIITRKQRATGEWPMTSFWYHNETRRLMPKPGEPSALYSEKPWL